MKMPFGIALGSQSAVKMQAVAMACGRMGWGTVRVTAVTAPSGQDAQPARLRDIYAGALTRAEIVREQCPDSLCIGIESGIVSLLDVRPLTFDLAVIVVLVPGGRNIVTTSTGIEFPQDCVVEAWRRGLATCTVGMVITAMKGGGHEDPHAALTGGKFTRAELLADGLVAAFKQI